VKVTPSNQTLILASERPGSGARSGTPLDRALNDASVGAVLKRVTIVAARPDTTVVYLRADYSSEADKAPAKQDPPSGNAAPPLLPRISAAPQTGSPAAETAAIPSGALVALAKSPGAQRDAYGNLQPANRDAAVSSSLPPAEQYARTQRILTEAPLTARIDVRA
jgi:hypothetical protein